MSSKIDEFETYWESNKLDILERKICKSDCRSIWLDARNFAAPVVERQPVVIDLDAVDWGAIQKAADESSWMPNEYMRNDWIADVCNFLKYGRAEHPTPPELAELQAQLDTASRMFDEVENSLADSCLRETELQAKYAQLLEGFEQGQEDWTAGMATIREQESTIAQLAAENADMQTRLAEACEFIDTPYDKEKLQALIAECRYGVSGKGPAIEVANDLLNDCCDNLESLLKDNERLKGWQGDPVALSVWYGSMPESNGKSNWTAILHRTGYPIWEGSCITLDRSEYPDRVRYEADRARYLIGELTDEPDILAYDETLHSGYVRASQPAPVSVVLPERFPDTRGLKAVYYEGWNACLDKVKGLNQ